MSPVGERLRARQRGEGSALRGLFFLPFPLYLSFCTFNH